MATVKNDWKIYVIGKMGPECIIYPSSKHSQYIEQRGWNGRNDQRHYS